MAEVTEGRQVKPAIRQAHRKRLIPAGENSVKGYKLGTAVPGTYFYAAVQA